MKKKIEFALDVFIVLGALCCAGAVMCLVIIMNDPNVQNISDVASILGLSS